MSRFIYNILLVSFASLSFISNLDAENKNKEHKKNDSSEFDSVEMIMHHIGDSHEWHLWGGGESSFTIPLPVILYTNGSLDIFMSSDFDHGHSEVKKGNRIYSIDSHGHITEKSGLAIIDFSITKNAAALFLSLIVLILIFVRLGFKSKKHIGAPKGIASFIEPLILFVKDDIVVATIGKKHAKYLPYLLTLFFFILINNLLGLIPGGANVTGNIAITFILSFITLIVTNLSGNKNYWSHIFMPPGVPKLLLPIMIPIEIVGIFSKPFALMIRLFANISAGHIIILSLISLIFMAQAGLGTVGAYSIAPISIIFVLFMYLIECLVAFLQAYIFTLLTSLFIGLAVSEDH